MIDDYREHFASVRKRPRMYLIKDDFATIVAYVEGHDQAHDRTLLDGFREWLITQIGCHETLTWWALVAILTPPAGNKSHRDWDEETDARAVSTLFDLLDEFLELRSESEGMRKITPPTTNGLRCAGRNTAGPAAPKSVRLFRTRGQRAIERAVLTPEVRESIETVR